VTSRGGGGDMFARPFRVEFIRRFSAQAAYINKFGFIYYVFGLISMRIINVYVRMGGPRGLVVGFTLPRLLSYICLARPLSAGYPYDKYE
jgi:hypothetical protein